MLNCGISGNCVTNLLARWKKDCINLHPDVISILIGVNDVWHELSQQEGVDAESFEEAIGYCCDTQKECSSKRSSFCSVRI